MKDRLLVIVLILASFQVSSATLATSSGLVTNQSGPEWPVIDHLMHARAYIRDLNATSVRYSSYEYGLGVYAVLGMLACLKKFATKMGHQGMHEDERIYIIRLIQYLEQECASLHVSVLQSSIIQRYFERIYSRLLQSNYPKFSTSK